MGRQPSPGHHGWMWRIAGIGVVSGPTGQSEVTSGLHASLRVPRSGWNDHGHHNESAYNRVPPAMAGDGLPEPTALF